MSILSTTKLQICHIGFTQTSQSWQFHKIDGQTFTSIVYFYSSEEQGILESRNVNISVVTFDRSPHFYGDAEQPPDA